MSESCTIIEFATHWKPVIDAAGIIVIPLVAGGAVTYVAWQQYRTNRQRLRFEQYDRRLRVYKAVTGFLAQIIEQEKRIYMGDLLEALSESHFLFGRDIPLYIAGLRAKAERLVWVVGELQRENLGQEEKNSLTDELQKLFEYFARQQQEVPVKFGKYLSLE